MDFLSYIVSLLVVAVLTYAARKWYGRDSLPSSPSTQTRIFVCVAWPGSGSPPCVSNLLSKAAWRSRICFGVCAREAVPRPNVRFVTQTSFAGASLSHAKCLSLSSGEAEVAAAPGLAIAVAVAVAAAVAVAVAVALVPTLT